MQTFSQDSMPIAAPLSYGQDASTISTVPEGAYLSNLYGSNPSQQASNKAAVIEISSELEEVLEDLSR